MRVPPKAAQIRIVRQGDARASVANRRFGKIAKRPARAAGSVIFRDLATENPFNEGQDTLPYNQQIAQVVENTGFELPVADEVTENAPPTAEELRILREDVDPDGFYR
ncbi:MAG: hypothetical protein P9L99_02055 [Candidatus Lernaella stagnicola]|nr:hypothetical protein [Candidatus Lernaella stagnicola]